MATIKAGAQLPSGFVFSKRRVAKHAGIKAEHRERLANISTVIGQYDPDFTRQKLDRAFSIVGNQVKRRSGENLNNRLSEPLDILETLVEHYQPDRDTVIAAVLYPTLLPNADGYVSRQKLKNYEEEFGRRTRLIIEDCIRMWARPVRSIAYDENDTDEARDIKRDDVLSSLLIAGSIPAVAIRCSETLNNLRDIERVKNPATRQIVMERAELIATLANLVRCPKMHNAILNEKFRIADPEKYKKTQDFILSAGTVAGIGSNLSQQTRFPLTDDDIQTVNRIVQERLETILGAGNFKFTGIFPKEPHSTNTKVGSKQQHVSQLGDLNRARCVIKNAHIDGLVTDDKGGIENALKNAAKVSSQDERDKSPEQIVCESVYFDLASQIGRHATDETTRRFFALLSARDPDGHGGDGRYDNYFANPKKSGYLSVQDTMVVFIESMVEIDGVQHKIIKAVEFEFQIVDEASDNNNYAGQPDHTLYKAGMQKPEQRKIVEDFRAGGMLVLDGDKQRTVPRFAAVSYKEKPLIVEASNTVSQACTFRDFVNQHIDLLRRQNQGLKADSDIAGVRVATDDPLANRDPEAPLSLDAPVRSGDTIVGFTFDPRSDVFREASRFSY